MKALTTSTEAMADQVKPRLRHTRGVSRFEHQPEKRVAAVLTHLVGHLGTVEIGEGLEDRERRVGVFADH